MYDSQGYGRYTYVRNNPVNYSDPSGHFLGKLIASAIYSVVDTVVQSIKAGEFVLSLALYDPLTGATAGIRINTSCGALGDDDGGWSIEAHASIGRMGTGKLGGSAGVHGQEGKGVTGYSVSATAGMYGGYISASASFDNNGNFVQGSFGAGGTVSADSGIYANLGVSYNFDESGFTGKTYSGGIGFEGSGYTSSGSIGLTGSYTTNINDENTWSAGIDASASYSGSGLSGGVSYKSSGDVDFNANYTYDRSEALRGKLSRQMQRAERQAAQVIGDGSGGGGTEQQLYNTIIEEAKQGKYDTLRQIMGTGYDDKNNGDWPACAEGATRLAKYLGKTNADPELYALASKLRSSDLIQYYKENGQNIVNSSDLSKSLQVGDLVIVEPNKGQKGWTGHTETVISMNKDTVTLLGFHVYTGPTITTVQRYDLNTTIDGHIYGGAKWVK